MQIWRYSLDGVAGLVVRRRCRSAESVVSVYNSTQAAIASSETWSVVCETHGSILGVSTLARAIAQMDRPEWCSDCQDALA